MKRTLANRLLAVAVMACMTLIMALPASAVVFEKKYTLTLEITEAKETGSDGRTTVELEYEDVAAGEPLTAALIVLLVGTGEIDSNELWAFESDNMAEIVFEGLLAYNTEDDGTAWVAWLDKFAAKSEITGDKGDLVALIKENKTVGDLNVNTPYELNYEPVDADVDPDDYARGNKYTFTMIADDGSESGSGGSGSGSGGSGSGSGGSGSGSGGSGSGSGSSGSGGSGSSGSGGSGSGSVPAVPTPDTPEDVVVDVPQTIPGTVATLPVEAVKVGEDTKVVINTKSETPVKVEIPVTGTTPGTVAVIIKADGTEQVIRDSAVTENGVVINVSDGDKLVIKDNSKSFSDVTDAHWGKNAVTFVAARGLFAGVGNNNFAPDQTTNRGMIVQVLHNLKYNEEHKAAHSFPDVGDHHWYSKAVSWASENHIVGGYGDGTFKGDKVVSREELVVMLWNYAGKQASKENSHVDSFHDAANVSGWAKDAMNWALENGILGGKGGKMLDPTGLATRAELAQMMKNFISNL